MLRKVGVPWGALKVSLNTVSAPRVTSGLFDSDGTCPLFFNKYWVSIFCGAEEIGLRVEELKEPENWLRVEELKEPENWLQVKELKEPEKNH